MAELPEKVYQDIQLDFVDPDGEEHTVTGWASVGHLEFVKSEEEPVWNGLDTQKLFLPMQVEFTAELVGPKEDQGSNYRHLVNTLFPPSKGRQRMQPKRMSRRERHGQH